MNRTSVAAGVSPAVEGGVSPPGIPGSWPVSRSFLNRGLPMNLSRQAIARVETGSLTPALSQGERVSRPALGDMPVPRSSEPSQLVPANACLNPANLAEHFLLLPPGEGRDEGRPLHSSRLGSWSQYVSYFWKTSLPVITFGSSDTPADRGSRLGSAPRPSAASPKRCSMSAGQCPIAGWFEPRPSPVGA